MTRDQLSLLLYLECRAVDNHGRVDPRHMNAEDFVQAKKWAEEGFIDFGRLKFRDVTPTATHYVRLSKAAFVAAHAGRMARAERAGAVKDG